MNVIDTFRLNEIENERISYHKFFPKIAHIEEQITFLNNLFQGLIKKQNNLDKTLEENQLAIVILGSKLIRSSICELNLIKQGYYLEADSILRNFLEITALIEYFSLKPEAALKWLHGKEIHYSAALQGIIEDRKKLLNLLEGIGASRSIALQNLIDEEKASHKNWKISEKNLYGFLCNTLHPNFKGFLSLIKLKGLPEDEIQISLNEKFSFIDTGMLLIFLSVYLNSSIKTTMTAMEPFFSSENEKKNFTKLNRKTKRMARYWIKNFDKKKGKRR